MSRRRCRGRTRSSPCRHAKRKVPHNGVAGRAYGTAYPPAGQRDWTYHGRPRKCACRHAGSGALAPHKDTNPENAAHPMRTGRPKRRPARPQEALCHSSTRYTWERTGWKYGMVPTSHTFSLIPHPTYRRVGARPRPGRRRSRPVRRIRTHPGHMRHPHHRQTAVYGSCGILDSAPGLAI